MCIDPQKWAVISFAFLWPIVVVYVSWFASPVYLVFCLFLTLIQREITESENDVQYPFLFQSYCRTNLIMPELVVFFIIDPSIIKINFVYHQSSLDPLLTRISEIFNLSTMVEVFETFIESWENLNCQKVEIYPSNLEFRTRSVSTFYFKYNHYLSRLETNFDLSLDIPGIDFVNTSDDKIYQLIMNKNFEENWTPPTETFLEPSEFQNSEIFSTSLGLLRSTSLIHEIRSLNPNFMLYEHLPELLEANDASFPEDIMKDLNILKIEVAGISREETIKNSLFGLLEMHDISKNEQGLQKVAEIVEQHFKNDPTDEKNIVLKIQLLTTLGKLNEAKKLIPNVTTRFDILQGSNFGILARFWDKEGSLQEHRQERLKLLKEDPFNPKNLAEYGFLEVMGSGMIEKHKINFDYAAEFLTQAITIDEEFQKCGAMNVYIKYFLYLMKYGLSPRLYLVWLLQRVKQVPIDTFRWIELEQALKELSLVNEVNLSKEITQSLIPTEFVQEVMLGSLLGSISGIVKSDYDEIFGFVKKRDFKGLERVYHLDKERFLDNFRRILKLGGITSDNIPDEAPPEISQALKFIDYKFHDPDIFNFLLKLIDESDEIHLQAFGHIYNRLDRYLRHPAYTENPEIDMDKIMVNVFRGAMLHRKVIEAINEMEIILKSDKDLSKLFTHKDIEIRIITLKILSRNAPLQNNIGAYVAALSDGNPQVEKFVYSELMKLTMDPKAVEKIMIELKKGPSPKRKKRFGLF